MKRLILLLLLMAAPAWGVTLSWDAPDDPRVVGYNVYYGELGSDFKASPEIEVGEETQVLIPDLVDGQTYEFAATSRDADGNESAFSDTLQWTAEPGSKTIKIPGRPREIRLLFDE